jgi:hypothetical protein
VKTIRLRHNERKPLELVEVFRTLRLFNLTEWRGTSAEHLERTGRHNERGLESLGVMLRLVAGHDLSHLDQSTRYINALEQQYRRGGVSASASRPSK